MIYWIIIALFVLLAIGMLSRHKEHTTEFGGGESSGKEDNGKDKTHFVEPFGKSKRIQAKLDFHIENEVSDPEVKEMLSKILHEWKDSRQRSILERRSWLRKPGG